MKLVIRNNPPEPVEDVCEIYLEYSKASDAVFIKSNKGGFSQTEVAFYPSGKKWSLNTAHFRLVD